MNPIRVLMARSRDEDGLAMVIAVILSGVIAILAVLLLSVGVHSDKATARGRHFTQSLHVAESGVEQALAKLDEAGGNLPSQSFSAATELGDFDVTITRQARNRYIIESIGGVRRSRVLGSERHVRVLVEPPLSFDKALFSFTTVQTKNNDIIEGDVWANHNVVLAQGTQVTGSVVGATGYIKLDNGALVDGDAWSGGFNSSNGRAIELGTNADVGGFVKASVVTVNCVGADNADYKVYLSGGADVGGSATTWGSVTGSGTVAGTITNNSCSAAPPTEAMPPYSYAPSNYDAATLHEFGTPESPSATALADFQTYVTGQANRISGTFYLNQSGDVGQSTRVDLTGVEITGDTTIITNTPVFANGVTDDTADAIFTLISTYQPPTGTSCDVNQDSSECSVHLKNNFDVSGATAVLVYTPYGPTAVKNNASQYGAIYADSIEVKNNQTMYYDDRVARVVGFGEVTYEITRWEELAR